MSLVNSDGSVGEGNVLIHIGRSGMDRKVFLDGKEIPNVSRIVIDPIEPMSTTTVTITLQHVRIEIEPEILRIEKA